MSSNQPDWDLLGKYMAGEATTDEQALVQQWLAAHPAEAKLLAIVDRAAPAMAPAAPSSFEVEAALRKVKANAQTKRTLQPRHRWLAAAAVLGALGVWTVLRSREHVDSAAPQIAMSVTTTAGQIDTVFVHDGSQIILAPNSSLQLTDRNASLRGQAYFDVVHNERRPFTVRTEVALIRDLGTSFDVREEDGGAIVVDVTAGVVELKAMADTTAQGVTLQPGDRGQVRRGGRPAAQRGRASAPAWTSGRLVLQNASMPEVQSALRRWYGVSLQVHDSTMQNRHVTATFAAEPIDQVLRVIALAVGGTVERRGNVVILHSAPQPAGR